MSRLIKKEILIPDEVNAVIDNDEIKISGKLGNLTIKKLPYLNIVLNDNKINISKTVESKQSKMNGGTMWSLINNAILGVTKGFEKILEIEGVGYRAENNSGKLILYLGFSHPVEFKIPDGINVKVDKNTIIINGVNKELVGKVASEIRKMKPPEPYKGKGIHYRGEYIRRKAGKKAGAVGA